MNDLLQSLAEQFQEPGTPYLSPARIGEFFDLQMHELAERAHVHSSAPTISPETPLLQKYLRDLIRMLYVATELTGDAKRAAFLLKNEPLPVFNHKTTDRLIGEGRTDDVIAYLQSLAGGAAG